MPVLSVASPHSLPSSCTVEETLFRQTSWKVGLWTGRARHPLGFLRVLGTYYKTLKELKQTAPLNKWTDSLMDPETKEGLESKEFKWERF